jgi:hypothetical protein
MLLKNICSTGITYDERHLQLSYFHCTGHKYHTVSWRYCEVKSHVIKDMTKYHIVSTCIYTCCYFCKKKKPSTLWIISGLYHKNMTIVTDDYKWCYSLERHSRVVNCTYRVINWPSVMLLEYRHHLWWSSFMIVLFL